MAWIEPVTNWSNGNRFTYADMNRITGNVNYLYPAANLPTYTQNDFLTRSGWDALLSALDTLVTATGLDATVPGDAMTGDTMNEVESLILALKERIELRAAQAVATIYAGDGIYTADAGQYPNAENYVRGV
jgi:hypothetical protein